LVYWDSSPILFTNSKLDNVENKFVPILFCLFGIAPVLHSHFLARFIFESHVEVGAPIFAHADKPLAHLGKNSGSGSRFGELKKRLTGP
jgi:hypothetical protein